MKIECLSDRLFEGENNSRVLLLTIEAEYADKEVRLSFVTPSGNAFVSEIIEPQNNEYTYTVPESLLDGSGILYAQLLIYGDMGYCAKSDVYEFFVSTCLADGTSVEGTELITLHSLDKRLTTLENDINAIAFETILGIVNE